MKFDYLIVGAGLFGSVFAYEMRKKNKSILVIDKRNHIAGNCYTENKHGIDVHVYGPHIFHTSSKKIWDYVNQFSEFNNFVHRPKVSYEDNVYSFPINLFTLYQLWGVKTPNEAKKKLSEVRIPFSNPRNLEEWILSEVGQEIYEKFIYGYTKKQWKREPKDLPSSIIKRLPIRLTYDDNYFEDPYQGIPTQGYTKIFQNLLDECNLELGIDFFLKRDYYSNIAKKIVYTGKVDEYYNYAFGELDYRTLRFEQQESIGDIQGNAIINYTDLNIPWTRITEHKHFLVGKKFDKTIFTKEFPEIYQKDSTPYYPINDDSNTKKYRKYEQFAKNEPNVIFGGRLAEFKYYDMHQVIASALHKSSLEK
jgi:UDP-galactopyranose mutase